MEIFGIISGIISFITLIVFFVMSGNVGAIRRTVENLKQKEEPIINYAAPFNLGELKEYQGKNQEALDCYMEAYFFLNKYIKKNPTDVNYKQNKDKIAAKIVSLGGTVKEFT